MRKVTVMLTLLVPDESSEQEIRSTLLDSFSEFEFPRHWPEAYVNTRYPPMTKDGKPDYVWLNRDKKIAEVGRRAKIARALKDATFAESALDVGEVLTEEEEENFL